MHAQNRAGAREPFKLGTFEQRGCVLIGIVLRDSQVIDLMSANEAFERADPGRGKLAIPSDPRWMRTGDTVVCTMEGIGSMTNPVQSE